jgi:hypothetical protein
VKQSGAHLPSPRRASARGPGSSTWPARYPVVHPTRMRWCGDAQRGLEPTRAERRHPGHRSALAGIEPRTLTCCSAQEYDSPPGAPETRRPRTLGSARGDDRNRTGVNALQSAGAPPPWLIYGVLG